MHADEFAGVDNTETATNTPQLLALAAPLQKGASSLSTSGFLSSYFSTGAIWESMSLITCAGMHTR